MDKPTKNSHYKIDNMIDIFIKSFNRPFYLDRCLKSIENFQEIIDALSGQNLAQISAYKSGAK